MWIAIIALASACVAAIGYSIWSRTRVSKLYHKIETITLERGHAIRETELAKINLTTAESNQKAAENAKARANRAAASLRKELNNVLELVAQGKFDDVHAMRASLDKLLSE